MRTKNFVNCRGRLNSSKFAKMLRTLLLLLGSVCSLCTVANAFDADLTKLAADAIGKAQLSQKSLIEARASRSAICQRFIRPPKSYQIRHHEDLPPTKRTLDNVDLANVIEAATVDIAARTGATKDDILHYSQQIDVRQTPLAQLCPPDFVADNVNCDDRDPNIRQVDGRCNNLKHPLWGAAGTAFARLVPAKYEDKIQSPLTKSVLGGLLPNPRVVSLCVSPTFIKAHRSMSITFVFMGQTIDHDFALTPMARIDGGAKGMIPPTCCGVPEECRHPECLPFAIAKDDPVYSKFNRSCIEFVRSVPALRESCRLGQREQVNEPTHWLDCSFNYGQSFEREKALRAYKDGLMATSSAESAKKNQVEVGPLQKDDFECFQPDGTDHHCFVGGDPRINENPELTAQHHLWIRQHNFVARFLKQWALKNGRSVLDEDLYQTARKIVVAEYQFAVFNEFLRALVGNSILNDTKNELELCPLDSKKPYCKDGFYIGYDDSVPPHVMHEFSTSAFRMGHTFLPEFFYRSHLAEGVNTVHRLADNFFNPGVVYEKDGMEQMIYGALTKNVEKYDSTIVASVRDDLFKDRKDLKGIGVDLFAFNVQRARDHGIAQYNDMRELCGLGRAKRWEDFLDVMEPDAIERLKCAYKSVDDVELFPGGVSELPVNNDDGLLGPTKACIIAQQFHQAKKGDRFWFERPGQFSKEQLAEIRKFSMAALYCMSTKIDRVQPLGLYQPMPGINFQKPCDEIPRPNLEVLATLLPLSKQ